MSSSNLQPSRRLNIRSSRTGLTSRDDTSSRPNSTGHPASSTGTGGGTVAALRKRSALVDMTNAATNRKPVSESGAMSSKDVDGTVPVIKGRVALRDSNGTAAFARGKAALVPAKATSTVTAASRIAKPSSQRTDDGRAVQTQDRQARGSRRVASAIPLRSKVAASATSTNSRSNSVQSDASRATTATSGREEDNVVVKRVKTKVGDRGASTSQSATEVTLKHKKPSSSAEEVAEASAKAAIAAASANTAIPIPTEPVRAKDEGWEDLEAEEADDPLMVTEYVHDIFEYMRKLELENMPNGDYILQQPDITWNDRSILVDWMIEVHNKFRLVPETLFLAQNIVDRFLSTRTISLSKLQLVGMTAMFIAAKYEEVLCPSVHNFIYLADCGYTDEEVLRAERYMLRVINFNLSYASPMNFLRRISKADNYDMDTRTVAKFLMEISLVDHRLLDHPPSLVAAAGIWLARLVLERGEWGPTLIHYSSYTVEELLPTAELMVDYCLRPVQHRNFYAKYKARKFKKSSEYVFTWARNLFGEFDEPEEKAGDGDKEAASPSSEDLRTMRVDLFEHLGLERPAPRREASDDDSSASGSRSRSRTPTGETNELYEPNEDDDVVEIRVSADQIPLLKPEYQEQLRRKQEEDSEATPAAAPQAAMMIRDITNIDISLRSTARQGEEEEAGHK